MKEATKASDRITTQISPDFLDTIGRSFKFSYAKGTAEWLKNSLDNYLRLRHLGIEPMDGAWPVFINMKSGTSHAQGPNLAVIDFGGTTYENIKSFFLYWGDTSAATLGGAVKAPTLTGGHGNGGKFFMREMWREGARILTWRDGKATSAVIDRKEKATTGEWEIKDATMTWREAMTKALQKPQCLGGADWLLSYLEENKSDLVKELDEGIRGFTVVVGMKAHQLQSSNGVVKNGKWDTQQFVDDIVRAPQARRPIRELKISVFVDGELKVSVVEPEKIEEDPEWSILETEIPSEVASMDNAMQTAGHLMVRKSSAVLSGRRKHLNVLVVLDKKGNPIGTYRFSDLPFQRNSNLVSFLFGELQLSFPGVESLTLNDREVLTQSETTTSLLEWVASEVWARVESIEAEQRQAKHRKELEEVAELNQILNKHARNFLQELESEILVDYIEESTGGNRSDAGITGGREGDRLSGSGEGSGIRGDGSGGGNGSRGDGPGGSGLLPKGKGGTEDTPRMVEVPGDKVKVRRPHFPRILLSGHDPDPETPDQSKILSALHPPLWQDDNDRKHNVWWINTEHPFAVEAIKRGGPKGASFKGHHLFMFVQVVQIESLRMLQRRQSELALDEVENDLTEMANVFLGKLPVDLVDTLLS